MIPPSPASSPAGAADHVKGDPKAARLSAMLTVNAHARQPLREIILRAKNLWKVRTGDVNSQKHMLPEPRERVREPAAMKRHP